MKPCRRQLVLAIVATDRTFQQAVVRGEPVWVGKCLHCNAKLVVAADGTADAGATIEHIEPRHHGGSDDLCNVALACARCNMSKGWRHDHRPRTDPRLREVVAQLQTRRAERWREASEVGGELERAVRRR